MRKFWFFAVHLKRIWKDCHVCAACGALVVDPKIHARWHADPTLVSRLTEIDCRAVRAHGTLHSLNITDEGELYVDA